MKKLLLAVLLLVVGSVSAYGTQTKTTVKGIHNQAPYIQHVMTADTTGEAACTDVEGYDHCTVKVDVGATINVDIDWGITETYDENFAVDTSLTNVTSDTIGNLSDDGAWLCYDIDTCTGCSLTLTIRCAGNVGDGF